MTLKLKKSTIKWQTLLLASQSTVTNRLTFAQHLTSGFENLLRDFFVILNKKENKVPGTICFEIRILRKKPEKKNYYVMFHVILQNLMLEVGLLFVLYS